MSQTGRGQREVGEGAAREPGRCLCARLPPQHGAAGEKVLVRRATGQLPKAWFPLLSTPGKALRPRPPACSPPGTSGAWPGATFVFSGQVPCSPSGGPERQAQPGWQTPARPAELTRGHGEGHGHPDCTSLVGWAQ